MNYVPTILIVNDDGYDAPGIMELFNSVKGLGNVYVVAPASQRSGASVGFTLFSSLKVEKVNHFVEGQGWKVSGTPADCVKVALSHLNIKPDLILSGINHGSNAGRNFFYSGTVGGVVEGALRGIPGIAFSFEHLCDKTFHDVKMFVPIIVRHTLHEKLPPHTLFNVTFPHHPHTDIKGIVFASQGHSFVIEQANSSNDEEVSFGGKWLSYAESAESDIRLLSQGYITIVPLTVREWTDYETLERHKAQSTFINERLSELAKAHTELKS